jgi:transposase
MDVALNVCGRSIVENMPPNVARDIKHQALILSSEGHSQPYIAHSLGISESTVKRAKKNSAEHGDIEGGTKKSGRKPKFSMLMEEVISCFWATH